MYIVNELMYIVNEFMYHLTSSLAVLIEELHTVGILNNEMRNMSNESKAQTQVKQLT